MRVGTVSQLFIVATAAITLTVGELARRWMISGTKKEDDPLDEDDPDGYHQRNDIVWQLAKAAILPLGYINCWLGNLILIGKENVEVAVELKGGVLVVSNHVSLTDTFIPQTILRFHGFKNLVDDLFRYMIGIKFVNRRPLISAILRGASYIIIVPQTMLRTKFLRGFTLEERKDHLRNAKRINTAAFRELSRILKLGLWTLLFLEGTRVPNAEMIKVHEGVAVALRQPGSHFLPMAVVGTNIMWKPGSWMPNLFRKVKIIVGRPIPYEEFERQAKELSKTFGVSENRALVDLVMQSIAQLLIGNGHREYAGYYARPLEKIYAG